MNNQEQGLKMDIDIVIQEYKERVINLTDENIMLTIYIKQLEKKLKESLSDNKE
ncbi:hypothetical protein PQE75_gp213 [Bacillus phage vB_BcoS-136]|uniref:Uncharacterized protein n=1 Tax=Bacillus phage vB_BcoS-136 TaxID=2419619 RepID=A0A3G3BW04_9CAUD|nr:hypothetical protein PQE75_gp213 [Bacillus phage vB_BcoS-136]AYP68266.1 hypothetical protein vBBcoS136_00152 [Bacillus phage vB_BcoS-136]